MSDPRNLVAPGYFVWNPLSGQPTYRHDDLEMATAEARKLAARNPGQTFLVIASVGAFQMPNPGPTWTPLKPDDGVPF